ncbi:ribosome small subunit-dependent GTPase A [Aliibacillus thermotolerans]|uniref:Small ribosomal subunit biogenesis GTPase RsgA n=1 Tax=Aliibacillus thermotolerans TaxID=1834418 RepID=A0ABW0U6S5_9BACI|nr:ribosome small subunit-dependent GTPase A [Aliibacillus thermotolerans]MDA3130660.1 ribosome small subunit-dependent GTPase A [Aliibacillus thermotolerans]
MEEGFIVKALSGYYYVENNKGDIYQCRGRGLFRKQNISPLVGDYVQFEQHDHNEGYIYDILPRKNLLVRPPVANVDQAFIISAVTQPAFSSVLLDRFLVLMEFHGINPIIVFNKVDLLVEHEKDEWKEIQQCYTSIGYDTFFVSAKTKEGISSFMTRLKNKLSIVAGQSGVGKTALLNALDPSLELKTGEISNHLGRGRHTTRHVELIHLGDGLIVDTPGFSSLEFDGMEEQMLDTCFPEMRTRKDECKFRGCSHRKEPKCAVKMAYENGEISPFRYEHYIAFYEEIKKQRRY